MGNEPPKTLGHRLQKSRERVFVGRGTERALFRSALDGGDDTFSVLYLHGPGGVGKSALLRQLSDDARGAGRCVFEIDARTFSPTPPAFEAEAGAALTTQGAVLVVDTFERCQALEGWLRTRFLPRLPYDAVVVIASRLAPDLRWRADPDWNDTLRVITMQDLTAQDARSLMAVKGVPNFLQEDVYSFARGHPLALTLAAEVATRDTSDLGDWAPGPDVVETLLAQLVGEVPSQEHRRALEACALVEVTTVEVLSTVVGDRAQMLFEWLRSLPFIESGKRGLLPHDVVRDALTADLRWRDPAGFDSLHRRIHDRLLERIRTSTNSTVIDATRSLLFLYRDGSGVANYVTWSAEDVYEDDYEPQHRCAVLRLAAKADGPELATLVDFWLDRQPRGFHLQRHTETGEILGFCAWLRLEHPIPDEIALDPVVAAVWRHSEAHGPPRPGEHIAVSRFAVDPVANSRTSPVMDLIVVRALVEWLRATKVSWSYMVTSDQEFWRPQMEAIEHPQVAADLRIGARLYGLHAHDWRLRPVGPWLARLNTEVVFGRLPAAVQTTVLPRAEFDTAVRAALRDLDRENLLAANALCSTRLADGGAGLRMLLTEAVEALAEAPRGERQHRAVQATYLRRVPTQEAAAARLDLPFSTYRRHLVAGVAWVCDWLWERELTST
ncbi:ATP-binding protein [Streptomyces sp. NPDC057717]|uniref:ATP-binding protein n=1 Tax=Streptomyces sp. NPDC057717 TaxID=3346224 RepID=UPI0036AD7244